ncbi:hypothetical protein HCAG_01203 [Histoplasma mississippiense (nom. inval.)]|uniref:hypothetical protein n=1 Tax=Ajellomyces capsulatus (strain NAm1 / WU24) TaxID=2059318 RepID=UPI000157B951|nr:hypothetical protein HCAG_01203 [Histoplasma mississippiense (nom. inval.)]EDN03338.1 hypothetical protein HCAG_01203 [Histoplasma mississippiense (nom. inval.)]
MEASKRVLFGVHWVDELGDIRVTSSVPVLSGYHDRQRAVQTPGGTGGSYLWPLLGGDSWLSYLGITNQMGDFVGQKISLCYGRVVTAAVPRGWSAHAAKMQAQQPLWSRIRYKLREPFAEFVGVFILVLFGDGSVAQVILSDRKKGDYQSINWGWGLGVMLGVYCSGISGAHLNPAVTLANCIFRKFPWRKFPVYVIAQMLGGFLAAGIVYGNYRSAIDVSKEALVSVLWASKRPPRASSVPIVAPFVGCTLGGFLYDVLLYTGESPINTPWMGFDRLLRPTPEHLSSSITYDHREWKAGLPVRSAILKPLAGRLVVGWVTTNESRLLGFMGIVPAWFQYLPLPLRPKWVLVINEYRRQYWEELAEGGDEGDGGRERRK